MKTLVAHLPATPSSSYPIHIGHGVLENIVAWLPNEYKKIVIITDTTVHKLYSTTLKSSLASFTIKPLWLTFPAGEKNKTLRTVSQLQMRMLEERCGRDTLIVAIGGGVVGDIAGFAAATYMRGIAYVQIPTTLLAMVDSSIGGKTGVDTPYGKNLIGAFWQPKKVIIDIDCLTTLPERHRISGLIEAIKMFLTHDAEYVNYCARNMTQLLALDPKKLIHVIARAIQIKSSVVRQDEKEQQLRMVLNFGHTIAHALEVMTQYKMLHGYAVAYGILVETKIAQLMGYLDHHTYQTIASLFAKLKIVGSDLKGYSSAPLLRHTRLDKKNKSGQVNYIILKALGDFHQHDNRVAHPVPDTIVARAFKEILQ